MQTNLIMKINYNEYPILLYPSFQIDDASLELPFALLVISACLID